MLLGYARISTQDQNLALQRDALTTAGCDRLFEDTASGSSRRLAARQDLLDYARPDDVVVVWRLDRLGRSLRDLVDVVATLGERGVGLRSLGEAIDTTSPTGRLTFHLFAALAQFEAELVRERTRAGLAAARRRGKTPGRRRTLDDDQVEMARTLLANPRLTGRQVAAQLGVHRATLYRSLAAQ